jgi:hypothetical protein
LIHEQLDPQNLQSALHLIAGLIPGDYPRFMNNKSIFSKSNKTSLLLCAALLGTLTGCVGYVEGPRADVYVAPPEPVVVVQDDYVYYPQYQVYYSSSRQQYLYLDGGAWVTRPQPRGVSVNVLFASPSVRMNFHDSPANHHAEIVQQYPKNWKSSGVKQDKKRKDDQDDQHGGNDGR